PSHEHVVDDVEVLRARPVRGDADAHVLEARIAHHQSRGSDDALAPGQDGDLGVAEGDAVEVDVVGGGDVEQHRIAVAVEDHRSVAGGPDHDGTFGRAAGRQVV